MCLGPSFSGSFTTPTPCTLRSGSAKLFLVTSTHRPSRLVLPSPRRLPLPDLSAFPCVLYLVNLNAKTKLISVSSMKYALTCKAD